MMMVMKMMTIMMMKVMSVIVKHCRNSLKSSWADSHIT
jgi:hypothetical protein